LAPLAWGDIRLYTSCMPNDPGSVRNAGPIAYFLTWTTYGSWLPGDDRGWVDRHGVMHSPDRGRAFAAATRMTARATSLNVRQRQVVVQSIDATCLYREWQIHARDCRTQHVHVVVAALSTSPKLILEQLKAWTSRRLSCCSGKPPGRRWWSRGGSGRWIFDQAGLESAVRYVQECQDLPRA